jgi:hypothetical protein
MAATGTEECPIDKAELERKLLPIGDLQCELVHLFAPGVYIRGIHMPAGAWVLGHEHKTEHFNIVLTGKANVVMDGKKVEEISAPAIFKSGPGVRKLLFIVEDMHWLTVHPTDETNVAKLEDMLVVKSEAWREHHASLEQEKMNSIEESQL